MVSALTATSETPNSTPAAAPSTAPWWCDGAPSRGAATSVMPSASIPASNAISIGAANAPWSPPGDGSVATSRISPAAVMPMPIHWRRGTTQPKSRSPRTATTITPVESTACTIDSGAIASAAT